MRSHQIHTKSNFTILNSAWQIKANFELIASSYGMETAILILSANVLLQTTKTKFYFLICQLQIVVEIEF